MAGPSASTVSFGNIVAPDIAAQQLQLQRQQQLVDLLRQQSLTPTPTETAGGMAVRQSPLGGVAKMLSAYLSGQRQNDIDQKSLGLNREMAQRYAQILGGGSLPGAGDTSSAPASSAPIDPNAGAALTQGAAAGSVGPTVANAQRMDAMPPAPADPAPQVTSAPQQGPAAQAPLQSAAPGSNNFNMANLLRGGVVSQLGGDAAGAAYWKQYEPTDATKMATAAGSDPVAANAAALRRAVFMTPTNLRPGGGAVDYNNIDPATGQPKIITMPAQPAPGTINMPTPGTPSGFTNVPVNGALPNIAAAAGAESGGKAAGKAPFEAPISLPMSDGRTLSLSRTEYAAYQQSGQLPARYSGVQPNAAPAPAPNAPGPSAQPADADRSAIYASEIAKTQDMITNPRNYMSPNMLAQDPTGAQFVARAKNDLAGLQNEAAKLRPNPAGAAAPQTGAAPVVGMTPPLGTVTSTDAAQKAPSEQMAADYGTMAGAGPQGQQSLEYIDHMIELAKKKPFYMGAGVGGLPGVSSFSTDAAEYEKARASYLAAQGKALGAAGTDAARATQGEAVPDYGKPQDAMIRGLTDQRGQLVLGMMRRQLLAPVYQAGNQKAYTELANGFDQNISPSMLPVLTLPGPQKQAAVQAEVKKNPALRPKFEWAFNNGLLK